ncbi:hypothetical protein AMTR_s00094p00080430 [Amborella trichopoda]|uniref:Uncharacterized protein n=1 Tax=Amborella trichopoda TaxID=13333 RepID=W1NR59_AMBTC|nr:hypothetical protein AMTR_s00094p00080430 [Amborella trichopoda]
MQPSHVLLSRARLPAQPLHALLSCAHHTRVSPTQPPHAFLSCVSRTRAAPLASVCTLACLLLYELGQSILCPELEPGLLPSFTLVPGLASRTKPRPNAPSLEPHPLRACPLRVCIPPSPMDRVKPSLTMCYPRCACFSPSGSSHVPVTSSMYTCHRDSPTPMSHTILTLIIPFITHIHAHHPQ